MDHINKFLGLIVSVAAALVLSSEALAQSAFAPQPPASHQLLSPPNNTPDLPRVPPPVNTAPPHIFLPRHEPALPVLPIVPTDLTQAIDSPTPPELRESPDALYGLQVLDESYLPRQERGLDSEGIIIKYKPGSVFSKPSNCSVKLDTGDLLVSIRRPSRIALLSTKLAEASFASDSDLEVHSEDGCIRFINLSALKQKLIVKVSEGVLDAFSPRVFSISPGYELLIADHKLHSKDLRPHDGYARRYFKTLENGQMAISEISLESVLKESDLLAQLQQEESNSKQKRILADMSKMAAVLNYMNGSSGFTAETKASLELKYQLNTEQKKNQ